MSTKVEICGRNEQYVNTGSGAIVVGIFIKSVYGS